MATMATHTRTHTYTHTPLHALVQHGLDRLQPVLLIALAQVYGPLLQTIELIKSAIDRQVGHEMEDIIIFLGKLLIKLKHLLSNEGTSEREREERCEERGDIREEFIQKGSHGEM